MHFQTTFARACLAGVLVLSASAVYGQNADEEAIKKVCRTETESYYGADADGWAGAWLHQTNCTRTVVANNSYYTVTGWSDFGPDTIASLKQGKPTPIDLKSDNYIIRADGNLAWVEYDQYINVVGGDAKNRRVSREYRVMVKDNGDWKIATQITHDPETFNAALNLENYLNNTGYALITAKKLKEAIDVFQLNVRLNPNSANCYDSLGEALALNGDKAQAIKNYEKAIALDSTREHSKTALAKLKE